MINILYIIAESIKNKKIMIKRKGESENGFKKTKLQVFRNTNISYQLSGVAIFFIGKVGVLCFLLTTILRFALLFYYRRVFKYSTQAYPGLLQTCKMKRCKTIIQAGTC